MLRECIADSVIQWKTVTNFKQILVIFEMQVSNL
jgi:hypothetical protein